MMIVTRLAATALALCLMTCAAAAQGQGILGIWLTEKKNARVEISNCAPPAQGLCGKIVWISEPNDKEGRPQTDKLVWPGGHPGGMKCSPRPAGRGRRIQNGAP